MRYTYEFNDTGGYDCMTGAFIIHDAAGNTVCDVDLRYHGQDNCQWPAPEEALNAAEVVAKKIVDALNTHSPQLDETK